MPPSPSPSSLPLAGRTALVTGSTGGIGHAIAQGLAGAGCNVVLHGLDSPQQAQPLQADLERRFGVNVGYVQADLVDTSAIEAMMDHIARTQGGVDVLVNNAVTRHFSPVESFPVAAWDRAMAVNIDAAFHTIRLSLPGMRQRGWGRIFNMTSVYGQRAVANRIDYITSKTALLGMTRAVALETVNQGITCNAICPGSVRSPNIEQRLAQLMQEKGLTADEAEHEFLTGKQPTQRFVESAHVADLMLFLCSPAGRDITGALLPIEGGWLAS